MFLEAASGDSAMKIQTLAQESWLQRLTSASMGTVWGSINFSSLDMCIFSTVLSDRSSNILAKLSSQKHFTMVRALITLWPCFTRTLSHAMAMIGKPSPVVEGRSLLSRLDQYTFTKPAVKWMQVLCYRRDQPWHAVVTCMRFLFWKSSKKNSWRIQETWNWIDVALLEFEHSTFRQTAHG